MRNKKTGPPTAPVDSALRQFPSGNRFWFDGLVALALTVWQIIEGCWLAMGGIHREAYLKFFAWDSEWYESIFRQGYSTEIPKGISVAYVGNIAFFPGYPLFCKAVSLLFPSLDSKECLLVSAAIATVGFWWIVLRILRHATPYTGARIFCLLSLFLFPTSFYLVNGYSESLFLVSLLLFLFLSVQKQKVVFWGVLGGMVCSATRIVGIGAGFGVPLASSVLGQWQDRLRTHSRLQGRDWVPPFRMWALGVLATLGGMAYFVYCQVQFNDWAIYQHSQLKGWHVVADPLALLKYRTFFPPAFPGLWDAVRVNPYALSQCMTCFYSWLWVALLWRLYKNFTSVPRLKEGAPFLLCAFALFAVSVIGLYQSTFNSMSRYLFPVHVGLVIWWAYTSLSLPDWKSKVKRWVPLLILSAYFHWLCLWRYTHYHWVA